MSKTETKVQMFLSDELLEKVAEQADFNNFAPYISEV